VAGEAQRPGSIQHRLAGGEIGCPTPAIDRVYRIVGNF
jgi:hypothetical protein